MIESLLDTVTWALALALCLPARAGHPARAWLAPVAVAALLWVPLGPTNALGALRGVVASPSVLSLVVVAALTARRAGWTLARPGEIGLIAGLAGVCGVLFYPPALGLGPVDPYAWGYGGFALPLAVGVVALSAGWTGRWVLAAGLAAALAAWRAGLMASPNLWDYLLDPLLALAGVVGIAVCALRARSRKRAG